MTVAVPLSGLYADPRPDWLALHTEAILDPALPIVDAHHHLWNRSGQRYLEEEFAADIATGHNIVASVYIDCRSMYRMSGPEAFRPVGEVEYSRDVARRCGCGGPQICAGIVGHADLRLGDAVQPVLEALIAAGDGRLRGIRHVSAWDADPLVIQQMPNRPPCLLGDASFRRGFACLAPLDLSFDAFLLHPQIAEVTDLARAFPQTRIVLDHVGGPIGIGGYGGRRPQCFAEWSRDLAELARCENVWVKLGGLGMRLAGFDFHLRPRPPHSEELAQAWAPYISRAIELFGAERCMFESNFPPDKGTCSYPVLWNAFKRSVAAACADDRRNMFGRNANAFYRLNLD
jgi:predicted TIM-barrel fold metal-dependent hydrolase